MAKSFSFPSPADFSAVLAKAKSKAQAAGGQLTGNNEAGQFDGQTPFGALAGSYRVEAGTVTITVDKQPMMLPSALIESQIKQLFTA